VCSRGAANDCISQNGVKATMESSVRTRTEKYRSSSKRVGNRMLVESVVMEKEDSEEHGSGNFVTT
jgi:hypothetical protein